ncbi:MAG: hypothetical protein ACK57N_13570 [Planctomycetia bacterium]
MRFSLLSVGCLALAFSGAAQAQYANSQAQGSATKGVSTKGQKMVVQKTTQTTTSVTPLPLGAFLVGGSDDCSTAQAQNSISGSGTFSVDTTAATTGAPVGSCGLMGTDVWFYYTATTTGTAVVETCGQSANDTVLAAWSAAGVPAGSCPTTQLACNDDNCGLQSRISFPVTNGQSYFISVGSYNGGAGWVGSFSVNVSAPATNDNCTAPTAINGSGPFNFATLGASTGTEGQNEALCLFFGQTAITTDVWYTWTAGYTGSARLSLCGGATGDTKVAVYGGNGCPTTAAIACNDDSCGLTSQLDFPCTQGQTYTIQLGMYPNAAGTIGTFTINQIVTPPNDECAGAIATTGYGVFPFDNTTATTSAAGQNEAACLFFGSTAVVSDVWYTWTAPATGKTIFSLCSGAANDSKIAIYAGGACPTAPALACNDDRCGLTSELCFDAVAGQTYLVQIGLYPLGGAQPTTGTFEFRAATGGAGNDVCATPTVLTGAGPFAIDTSFATTGCEGQDNGACLFFGSTVIDNDLWYTWTAPSTGNFQISMCGSGNDTKLAVYDGAGCPTTAAIACNDDACALQSQLCFPAVAGNTYTLQIGAYPGSGGGPGTLSIGSIVAPTGCQYDDGVSDNSIGLGAGGGIVWLNRFGSAGATATINSVSATYDTPLFPGVGLIGLPVTACIWDDPNDDGNPSDCVLVAQVAGTVANQSADIYEVYNFGAPVSVSGVYFVGMAIQHPAGEFPASLDQSGCPAGSNGRSWVAGNTAGAADIVNLAANPVALTDLDAIGFPGVWQVRADCSGAVGTAFCFGDGSGTACPCGNAGAAGNGCANSLNANGAKLEAQGSASVSNDTITLRGSGMSTTGTCLYFQGTTRLNSGLGAVFGDGLRCAGGTIIRLGTKVNSAGGSQYGFANPTDIRVSVRGVIPAAGATRTYQVWYRNAGVFCTPSTFNLSNGLELVWAP